MHAHWLAATEGCMHSTQQMPNIMLLAMEMAFIHLGKAHLKDESVLQLLGLDVSFNSLIGTLPRSWGTLIQARHALTYASGS